MMRRNKLLYACEPCRKSKVKCDHKTPICERCITRGYSDKCEYHPAPMTKPRPEHHKSRTFRESSPYRAEGNGPGSAPQSPVRQEACRLTPGVRGSTSSDTTVQRPIQYLGSTSYVSTILEPQDHRFTTEMGPIGSAFEIANIFRSPDEAALIERLRSFSVYELMLQAYCKRSIFNVIPYPLILCSLPHIKSQLQKVDEIGMERFLDNLIHESVSPLIIPSEVRADEFHKLYTGDRLRWEIIGFVFATAGLVALTLPSETVLDILRTENLDPAAFVSDMVWASNACTEICQRNCAINDIYLWLLYHNSMLLSNHVGDFSHFVWRRFNDLAGEVFAMGLHRQSSNKLPFWLSETRKRLFAAIFKSDKVIATFLGRPPRIPRFYCNVEMPLDIDDTDIILNAEDINAVLSRLDSNGWDVTHTSEVRPASALRMRYQISLFREEILELSLGQGFVGSEENNTLMRLRDKGRSMWANFPRYLKYEETTWSCFPETACLVLLIIFLEYSTAQFQIERMLCKENRGKGLTHALLHICMEVVSTIIGVAKQRHVQREIEKQFTSLLLLYGIPCVGVLATELRSCALNGRSFPASISRAEVIKNLSFIISCLEWVAVPKNREYTLCAEINKIISNIFDEALNSQPSAISDPDGVAAGRLYELANATTVDLSNLNNLDEVSMQNEDFQTWLETFDWPASLPAYYEVASLT